LRKGSSIDNGEVSSDFITRWVSRRYPPGNPIDTSYLIDWRNLGRDWKAFDPGGNRMLSGVFARAGVARLEKPVGRGGAAALPLLEK